MMLQQILIKVTQKEIGIALAATSLGPFKDTRC